MVFVKVTHCREARRFSVDSDVSFADFRGKVAGLFKEEDAEKVHHQPKNPPKMKTINDDPEGFFDSGGWSFLEPETKVREPIICYDRHVVKLLLNYYYYYFCGTAPMVLM